jgi:superfamily I DNA and/or RNA helicase
MTLFSGRKSSKAFARTNLYRFEMLIQRTLPDGSQGRLIVSHGSSDAKVVATEGQFIWLDLSHDLGERIPQAYYDVDLSFLLKDLKEKYSSLIGNPDRIVGPGANLIQGCIPEIPVGGFMATNSLSHLSIEQGLAIENALSMVIGAIHGPPGTGKTRTLAGALVECFLAEERILVCAYTNRAVDEALSAFKRASKSCGPDLLMNAIKSGRILRKGLSVFSEEDPVVQSPEEATDNLRSSLEADLDSIRKNIRDKEDALRKLKILQKQVMEKDGLRRQLVTVRVEVSNVTEKFEKNTDVVRSLDNLIQEAEREYVHYEKEGVIKRIFTKGKRRGLLKEIQEHKHHKNKISLQQQNLIKRRKAFEMQGAKIEEHLAQVEREIAGQDTANLKGRMDSLIDELEKLKMEVGFLEQTISEASDKVMDNALVIFATLSRTHLDEDIHKVNFDRVFVDEASMASLPSLFWAGFLARKGIHIFGDPKQLAPICTSRKEEVREWFAKDIYQYAGLDDPSKSAVAGLKTQRRMNTELGELVSRLFYENQLEHDIPEEPQQIFPWMSHRKVAIVDTTNEGPFCNRHESGKGFSRLNVVHAVVALNITKEASDLGIDSSKMAYITPYRAQAEFFGALVLKNRDVSKTDFLPDLRWGTVHRFQGGEAELVIYDTCESPRQLPTRLTGGSTRIDTQDMEIDDSTRLHCVACSRAKSNLIILANLKWLRENLPKDSTLAKLIGEISKMGSILPVPDQHSALKLFSKEVKRGLFTPNIEDSPYVLCDESEFYHLLKDDLATCKKNVTIVSPYLSERRISSL